MKGLRSQMMSSTSTAMKKMRRHGSFLVGLWYPRGSRRSPRNPQKGRGSALVMKYAFPAHAGWEPARASAACTEEI